MASVDELKERVAHLEADLPAIPTPPNDVQTVVFRHANGVQTVFDRRQQQWKAVTTKGTLKYRKMQHDMPCPHCDRVLASISRHSGTFSPANDAGYFHRGKFCPFTHPAGKAPIYALPIPLFNEYNAEKMRKYRAGKRAKNRGAWVLSFV